MRTLVVQIVTLFFVGVAICAPRPSRAESCKDGRPLLELATTSDAIAVLKKSSLVGGIHPQGYAVQGFHFSFDEFIKYPVIDGFEARKPQLLRHETKLLRVRDPKKYFAFMRYVAENTWTVVPCGLMEIAPDNDVIDACTRVSDLYGENRFVRERRCLLSKNPDVGVQAFRAEIEKGLIDNKSFDGFARIVSADPWLPKQNYLRVRFSIDARQAKGLYEGFVVRRPIAGIAYIRTEAISKKRYLKRSRKGRRFEFRGLWYKGSLLLEDFE